MSLSPLQTKLLGENDSIEASEMSLVLFPLAPSFVKERIADTGRFKERVLRKVMQEWEIDLDRAGLPFDKEHILQAILRQDPREMLLSLGLSWNAEIVSQQLFRSQCGVPSRLLAFPKEELKFAMKFRSVAPSTRDTMPSHDDVLEDGKRCFSAWIDDIPHDAKALVQYFFGQRDLSLEESVEPHDGVHALRVHLADAWCEEKLQVLSLRDDAEDET